MAVPYPNWGRLPDPTHLDFKNADPDTVYVQLPLYENAT